MFIVALIGDITFHAYRILVGNSEGKSVFWRSGLDERIILKCLLKK
jgi:hypothetical protein